MGMGRRREKEGEDSHAAKRGGERRRRRGSRRGEEEDKRESGSIAYATGKGSAVLRRSFQAPFCFTGWYHISGVKRHHLFFHVSSQGKNRIFHFSSEPFVGFWYKVLYPEKWTGLANVSIASILDPASQASFVTLDDLTFEPGPCPPAPQEGSCNFDWGDTCGYSVGNRSGLWQLNHWKASDSDISWTITEDVTVGHGGGFAIFKPSLGTNPVGVLSSPKDTTDPACLSGASPVTPCFMRDGVLLKPRSMAALPSRFSLFHL
ncbi:hypothetical protein ISCGN_003148 [Ixodes scapularis]